VEAEVTGLQLRDQRLERRLRRLMEAMAATPGQPLPVACGDWAATKAAYRFFDNPKISESGMMAGHFASTALRFAQHASNSEEPVLILQDTTEFLFKRAAPEKIGFTKTINGGHYKAGQPNRLTLCGLLMHSSLAVTTAGVPFGLAAVKFWTRDSFKGTAALKRHVNPTRVPIETKESFRWLENLRQSVALLKKPQRCIHVGDRESDIYELYCLAQELDTKFLVRAQTDSLAAKSDLADNEPHRVRARLAQVAWAGTHEVAVAGKASRTAKLQVKFATIETLPPIGK
jgi:Transposase DNA-binding